MRKEQQTIEYYGIHKIPARHTDRTTGKPTTTETEAHMYQVVTTNDYGFDDGRIDTYTDIYPVINHPVRDSWIVLSYGGFENGSEFYDRPISIPKILIKELAKRED